MTSTWTNLDISNKPNFTITTPGEAFQFTESYSGLGLSNHTIINRTTTIQAQQIQQAPSQTDFNLFVGSASPTFASDIGGVSATANPVANSSGSVTNQANTSFTRSAYN